MSKNRCLVELGVDGEVITIFKYRWQAVQSPAYDLGKITEWPRKDAVGSVRKQVFIRANGLCERCGARLTWRTAQMDEKVSKGEGGLVSLENCWALCYGCHQGNKDSEHGDRKLRFGERT